MPTRVPAGNIATALGSSASFPRTTFDFFPFAGIHRPVVLYTVPQAHIEDVTIVTGIDGADGTVKVTARLNEAVAAQGTVTLTFTNFKVNEGIAATGFAPAELRSSE